MRRASACPMRLRKMMADCLAKAVDQIETERKGG